ncbi:hypothetical protein ALC53_08763 [Atta colombica]|uniref:Uncharacterized protein n=1 Tax=Atta colombica TaxID=520822 RepID=A0A195B953_9HYME|nr:hypothetical protein ALC53_08763 [Atta colombica]
MLRRIQKDEHDECGIKSKRPISQEILLRPSGSKRVGIASLRHASKVLLLKGLARISCISAFPHQNRDSAVSEDREHCEEKELCYVHRLVFLQSVYVKIKEREWINSTLFVFEHDGNLWRGVRPMPTLSRSRWLQHDAEIRPRQIFRGGGKKKKGKDGETSGRIAVREDEEWNHYEIRDTRSDNCYDNAAMSICSRGDERTPLTFDDCAQQTMANWEQVALENASICWMSRIDGRTCRKRSVYASSYCS